MKAKKKLKQTDKRKGIDRRRFGKSMIDNFAQHDGPDRRSGDERRVVVKTGRGRKKRL